jgi:hypothetical protein
MTKKDFIALADEIRQHNKVAATGCGITAYAPDQINALADWLAKSNPRFNRAKWLGYVAGESGPGGGKR